MLRTFRKSHILFFMCVFGLVSLCLTNGFADEGLPPILEAPTADGAGYIQGNDEYQRGPDSIIGTRDFEKMRDLPRDSQDYQLGTKIGWFYIPSRNNPNLGFICTGFLVGPDLFMTNHHCIHDDFGLLPIAGARIYMDYYQDRDVDPTFGGVTARVTEILRMDESKDYALLRLDSPIGDTYGWLELDTETRPNSSQSVKLISHPAGRSKEIVRRNTEIVDIPAGHPLQDAPYALAYLADSEGGSSGSPVFLREGTSVIGIHHSAWTFRGDPHFNAGTLMSYIVPEIQQWLPSGPPTPPGPPIDPPVPPPTVTGIHMYWTDTGSGQIQRANLDGSDVADLVQGLTTPTDIAVDVTGKKIYWTDTGSGQIQRANFDGSNVENLITGLVSPTGIAVDAAGNNVYWTDTGTGAIQRANLDGLNQQDLITGLVSPTGIALNVQENHMHWTDTGAGSIQRANLDGSGRVDLITGLLSPAGITLSIPQGGGPVRFDPSSFPDQTFTVGQAVSISLPQPTGGTPPYTCTLTPELPPGLYFEGKHYKDDYGFIGGTPTTPADPRLYTYTCTDTKGVSASLTFTITVIGSTRVDVNGDGVVDVKDLVLVARAYGTRVPAGTDLPEDVNLDLVVNLIDLTLVAHAIDAAGGGATGVSIDDIIAALKAIPAAPNAVSGGDFAYRNVAAALADAKLEKGIPETVLKTLQRLLLEMRAIPETTALLPNYPNPFNPETWIPYHLAKDAAVVLTIYDVGGSVVRTLKIGHQPAGVYQSKHRAAYWDGKNQLGEHVASGLYFYTLTAGDFTATRKLLIAK